eukprot:6456336-Amphidinium_carterae.1
MAVMEFTGNGSMDPHTLMGKLLALSYSVFILLLVSAYTATLAAFQVVRASETSCSDLVSCLQEGKTLCTEWPAGADSEWLLSSAGLPWLATSNQLVRTSTLTASLQAGECDMLFTSAQDLENWKLNADANPDCDLQQLGPSVQSMSMGWMGKVNDLGLCTSMMLEVLGIYTHELLINGETDDSVTASRLALASRPPCSTGDTTYENENSPKFTVGDVLGSLALHVVVMTLVALNIGGGLLRRWFTPAQRQQKAPDSFDVAAVEPSSQATEPIAVLTSKIKEMDGNIGKMDGKIGRVESLLEALLSESMQQRAGSPDGITLMRT